MPPHPGENGSRSKCDDERGQSCHYWPYGKGDAGEMLMRSMRMNYRCDRESERSERSG
jgi:hypothetical protein